jgi:lipoprotein NlpI
MSHLLKGDAHAAQRSFEACVATGVVNFNEYEFARAEIERLGSTPAR